MSNTANANSFRSAAEGNPLVSVIIPAYNHEKYIEAAVRSVWTQDYEPIELIVLDDGSSDGTVNVLRTLKAISPIRMVLIEKENEGICRTLNRGLALANGKYVGILASDDEFSSNKTFAQVTALESNKDKRVAGCYGDRISIDEHGNILNDTARSPHEFDDHFLALIRHDCTYHLQASTFDLSVVKTIGFDPDLYFEDWDFFLRLTADYELVHVPAVAFKYRIHGANISGENAPASVRRITNAGMHIFEKLRSHPRVQAYGTHRFKAHVCIANAKRLYATHLYSEARVWLWRAWCSNPKSVLETFPLAIKLIMGRHAVDLARRIKYSLK